MFTQVRNDCNVYKIVFMYYAYIEVAICYTKLARCERGIFSMPVEKIITDISRDIYDKSSGDNQAEAKELVTKI